MNLARLGLVRHPERGLIKALDFRALTDDRDELKKRFGIIDLDKNILEMTLAELRSYFGYKNGNIKKDLFIRNVVEQVYKMIRAGNPPDFFLSSANVRSFSYYTKDYVRKHRRSFGGVKDLYGVISTELTAMVKAGLYSYKDFNIVDERRVYRKLAPVYANPQLILIGEKISFFGLCVKYWNRYGVTIQMTQGIPSFTTSDTTLTEMAEAGFDMDQTFTVLAFTDFDPYGWNIARTFISHLRDLGLKNIRAFRQYRRRSYWLDLVPPTELDSDFLERHRYRLSARVKRTQLAADWANATGGLYGTGGKDYGLSADHLLSRLDAAVETKIQPYLERPSEEVLRIRTFDELNTTLEAYLLQRLVTRPQPLFFEPWDTTPRSTPARPQPAPPPHPPNPPPCPTREQH